jgi:hypothetical protein
MPGGPLLGTKASMCAWCAGKSHVAACAIDVTGAGCKDLVLRAHARGECVRSIHTAARRNPSPAILWSEGGRLERTCSGVDPFVGHIDDHAEPGDSIRMASLVAAYGSQYISP